MKDEIKSFSKEIVKKDVEAATQKLPSLYKAIDKSAKNGIIKKNNADRKKSRLTKKLEEIQK